MLIGRFLGRQMSYLQLPNDFLLLSTQQDCYKKFEHSIKLHCSTQQIQQYWCKQFLIDDTICSNVDWQIFGKANDLLTASKWLFITKHATGISVTGRNTYLHCERATDQLPRCGKDNKNRPHIVQCQAEGTNTAFLTGLVELELWLQKTISMPIEKAIITLVSTFCNNKEYKRPDNLSEEVSEAIKAQLELGLDCFLCSFLAKQWQLAQKVHLTENSSPEKMSGRFNSQTH